MFQMTLPIRDISAMCLSSGSSRQANGRQTGPHVASRNVSSTGVLVNLASTRGKH